MTGYALFIPALPYTGEWRQITGTYQQLLDAFDARNKLLEFDEVDFLERTSVLFSRHFSRAAL